MRFAVCLLGVSILAGLVRAGPLEIRGTTLLKHGRPVPTATGEPTGAIHCLERDPAGATYVGAAEGLFIIGDDASMLERVTLPEGAPPGAPRELRIDAQRRLWIRTDTAFGCVDLLRERATTLADADGYRPDTGPPPRITAVTVNGKPLAAGAPVRVTYPGTITLEFEGSGRGTLHFAILSDWSGRHGTRKQRDGTFRTTRLDPGSLTLAAVAIDQDLNESEPVLIPVEVAWPKLMDPARVRFAALAIVAILLGIFWKAGWRAGVSGVLVVCLGGQLLAAVIPHARGWPFVGFGMYTVLTHEDDVVGAQVLELIAEDGSTRRIDMYREIGHYPGQIAHHVTYRRDVARRVAARLGGAGVQLRVLRYRLTEDGPVPLTPRIKARYVGQDDDG